ncbi:MAG: hypothetical protein J0M28_12535 [Thauera sp.]|nr:hypothetical protein [Thauera sp.]
MTRLPHPHNHPLPGTVTPAQALQWLATGWKLFLKNPGVWLLQSVLLITILILLGLLPVIGGYLTPLALPLLTAGMLSGGLALERGERLRVAHLFDGFRRHLANLMVVGVFYALGVRIVHWLGNVIGGNALLNEVLVGAFSSVGVSVDGAIFGVLIFTLLWVLLMMALWFAPALVALHDVAPLEAMQISVQACFRNPMTFLVLASLLYMLVWIAMLPFGLGMLVLVPMLAGTLLEAWQDTFHARPALPAPTHDDAPLS